MHEELAHSHGALNCGTILLDHDGKVKIGMSFGKEMAVTIILKPILVSPSLRREGSTR